MKKKNMLGNGSGISVPVAAMSSEEIRQQIREYFEDRENSNDPKESLIEYINYLDKQIDQTYITRYGKTNPAYTNFINDKNRVVKGLNEGLLKRRSGTSGVYVSFGDNRWVTIPTPPVQEQDLFNYLAYIDRSFDQLYEKYSIHINVVGSVPHLSEDSSIIITDMPGGRRHKKRPIKSKKNKRIQRKTRRRIQIRSRSRRFQ